MASCDELNAVRQGPVWARQREGLFTEIRFTVTYRDSQRPVAAGEWLASAFVR